MGRPRGVEQKDRHARRAKHRRVVASARSAAVVWGPWVKREKCGEREGLSDAGALDCTENGLPTGIKRSGTKESGHEVSSAIERGSAGTHVWREATTCSVVISWMMSASGS